MNKDNVITIRFYNKRKHCYETTLFSNSDWANIKRSCALCGIPLDCEVL